MPHLHLSLTLVIAVRTCLAAATKWNPTCLNNTHCAADSNLFCDLTAPADWYVCNGPSPASTGPIGAVDITAAVLGKCKFTPCKRCSVCLADMAAHVADMLTTDPILAASYKDAAVVADKLKAFCYASTGTAKNPNRTAAMCDLAVDATLAQGVYQGNAGKRAALICEAMGECVQINITASCPLGSASVPTGSLDFCTPHGTNGTTKPVLVAGVQAAIDPGVTRPTGGCLQHWHCNTTVGYECVLPADPAEAAAATKLVTCSAGVDNVVNLGTCKPTPCHQCKTCYTAMKALAVAQAAVTDPIAVAAEFKAQCLLDKTIEPAQCSTVALQVEASPFGNLGKRPFAVCAALGRCDTTEVNETCVLRPNTTATEVTITAANADLCTKDSSPYIAATQLPSVAPHIFVGDDGECCCFVPAAAGLPA